MTASTPASKISMLLRFGAAVTLGCTIASCTNLSGIGGGATAACSSAQGTPCQSIATTYARRPDGTTPPSLLPGPSSGPARAKDSGLQLATKDASPRYETAGGRPRNYGNTEPGTALRSDPIVLRGWFKPWEDSDGDLFEATYVYMAIDSGRWMIDYNPRRVRDRAVRLRPPTIESTPSKRESNADAVDIGSSMPAAILGTTQLQSQGSR